MQTKLKLAIMHASIHVHLGSINSGIYAYGTHVHLGSINIGIYAYETHPYRMIALGTEADMLYTCLAPACAWLCQI